MPPGRLHPPTESARTMHETALRTRRGDNANTNGAHPLPRHIVPKAPPIKMQGIKTKIVPLIARSIAWSGDGRWIEPFLGSGAVAFNIAPRRAILSDTNRHVIALYRDVQRGIIDGQSVRAHLRREGAELRSKGEKHYYAIRDRFNEEGDSLDFLFLSRSCFNGMMRFNRRGDFNVPFCRKPERFRRALVTKIVNQIEWARSAMSGKDWQFVTQDWRTALAEARPGDMIYCDPPYIGRHTDYYNGFTDGEADDLAAALIGSPAGFALSMWLENKYRRNDYVDRWFADFPQRALSHFYHVGPTERLRNAVTEAVILSETAVADTSGLPASRRSSLFETAEAVDI